MRDLIEYVENPAKTASPHLQDFFNVFAYAQNPEKTAQGDFVTAINCVKEIALEQMILTKKQFGNKNKKWAAKRKDNRPLLPTVSGRWP